MAKATAAINRLQERRKKTARDLLEGARKVIAKEGYHKTKIADIARAANVGVGTFYLYYPTKQAIFLELVEDTMRRLKAELDSVRDRATDPAALRYESSATFLRFAQENRELFRIVFGHGADFHKLVRKAQGMFVRDVIENLQTGIQAGVFRPHQTEIVAHAIIGLSVQVVTWWLENEDTPIEEIRDTVMELVLHGIASDTPKNG
jgi:AcrR family transcriptional regulator